MRIRDWRSDVCSSDLHRVGLAALGGEARLAGLAPVEPVLQVLRREGDARRHAVDHAADGGTVALAPGGEADDLSETVACHRRGASRTVECGPRAGRKSGE